MLVLVRPRPKRNSAANRLAVPSAKAVHTTRRKERQRRQQRLSCSPAFDDAADDQRTGQHARRNADQCEAELRFAEPQPRAQFGDAREESPHRRAMGGEDQHDCQSALVAAHWSQRGGHVAMPERRVVGGADARPMPSGQQAPAAARIGDIPRIGSFPYPWLPIGPRARPAAADPSQAAARGLDAAPRQAASRGDVPC